MDNQNNENISTDVNQEPIDMTSASVNPVKAPKKKAPIIIGSVLGVAAVGGVAAAAAIHFNPGLNDYVKRKTSEPKDYFAEKESDYIKENTKTLSENMEKAGEVYSSLDLADFDLENFKIPAGAYNITGSVSLDMEKLSDLVMQYTPSQTDTTSMSAVIEIAKSFKSFSLGGKFVSDGKGLISTTGEFTLNDSSVIDAQIIFDTESKSIYVALPSVSSKFIKYTIPEEYIEQFKSELEKSFDDVKADSEDMIKVKNTITDVCNVIVENSDDIAQMIEDYYKIIIDGVKDDIERDDDASLEIAGSEFSVVEMTTTIDSDDAAGIITDILTEAKDDKTLKSIASSMGIEDEFDKGIADALDEMKDVSKSDIKIDITAWSDKKGNIIGHKFKSEESEFGYATLENKDDTYSSFWISDGKDVTVSFDCIAEGKDKESGTMSYKIDSDDVYAVITLDYDNYEVVDASKGLVNFDARISADYDFDKLLKSKEDDQTDDNQSNEDDDSSAVSNESSIENISEIVKNTVITLSSKCEEDSAEISYGVEYDGDSLSNFSIKCEKLSDTTIDLPSDSDVIELPAEPTSENLSTAIVDYLTSVNLVTLKDNVKNAINNTMVSTVIDQYFTQAGLDKFDGTQKADDVTNLIQQFSAMGGSDYDDEDYAYDTYDDEDTKSSVVDVDLSNSDNTEDVEDIDKLFN